MAQNIIRVPRGCPTVEKAIELAVVFSERKDYTETDPLKIQIEKGVYEITDSNYVPNSEDDEEEEEDDGSYDKTMLVPCSHITLVGKGKDQTTIRGGFAVRNQQNVKFEEMTVTNPVGCGFVFWGSETNVDVLKCAVKECAVDGRTDGMYVHDGVTVTATQCEFMENGRYGVFCCDANTKARLNDCKTHNNGASGLLAFDHAVVDLHGTKTDIHSNKSHGILAGNSSKVNIHLPSQHNTTHDNVGQDRVQGMGGGSIANINADGTFTHNVHVPDANDY
jgi:hypothetical protein